MSRALTFVVITIVATSAHADVIYVNDDAAGANDGSSWADAFSDLQAAIARAQTRDEIWVAGGTYRPSVRADLGDRRSATFQLKNGVGIYGGFAGNETSRDQRDWRANPTILSGDLNGDDADVSDPANLPTEPTRQDNSYHVVTASNVGATVVLDGFIITAGRASNRGGGMYNWNSDPTLTNCTFTENSARWGGGMHNQENSNPEVTSCTFEHNSADDAGGGMHNWNSDPTLTNCTFTGNSARWGGGMHNQENSNPE